jgi:hypothetical protein
MLIVGQVLFLIWYVFMGVLFANLFGEWWIGILFVLVMYILGKFTMRFLGLMNVFDKTDKWKSVFKRNRNIYEALKTERASIIADILAYDKMFQKAQKLG